MFGGFWCGIGGNGSECKEKTSWTENVTNKKKLTTVKKSRNLLRIEEEGV